MRRDSNPLHHRLSGLPRRALVGSAPAVRNKERVPDSRSGGRVGAGVCVLAFLS
jgi:hypothetical protein